MATILIVDDRPSNRQFLATLLGYGGHRLLEAADGVEALRLVRAERPDLVISDILMPTMDGFEFAKCVRADPEFGGTRIVFYTATYRAQEARLLATACGVSTVIAKPADPQRVLDVVNEQLGIPAPQSVPRFPVKLKGEAKGTDGEPSQIGVVLADYANDLRGLKLQLDELVERGLELQQERDRLRGISSKFAQNVAQLHTTGARLYALIELGMDLACERDPQRLVQMFTSGARRIIGSRTAVTLVMRPTEDLLQHVETDGLDTEAARRLKLLALEDGLLGRVITSRTVVRTAAAPGEETLRGLPEGHPPAKSFMGAAVGSGAGFYGVAFFADKLGGAGEFDLADEVIVQALAAQLAVIYENFELYDTLQRHATQLQIEVAERKRAQEALQESKAGLHRAQVMAKLAHVITGPDGSFEIWSDTLPQLIGVDPSRMPGSTREWLDIVQPEDRATFRARAIEAGVKGARTDVEYRLRRSDGTCIDVYQVMEPIAGPADAPGKQRWFNTLQDVTEQKRVLEALRASEERHRAMFEHAAVGIVHSDLEGRILLANPKMREMTGHADEEITSLGIRDLTHPEDIEASVSARSRLVEGTGAPYEREFRLVRKNGSHFWVHATTSLVRRADGSPAHFISVLHDITERKQAEEKIRRLNRVYAVLSGINALIVRVRDRDELFRESCRIAAEAGNFAVAWAGVLERDASRVTPVAWQGVDEEFVKSIRRALGKDDPDGGGVVGAAIRSKQAVIANDIEHDSRIALRSLAVERGSRALAVLPLIVAGESAGVLVLHARETGFFDDEEMKLLRELAGDISFAMEHIEKSEKVDYLVHYDSLTGLPNRTLFNERFAQYVHGAEREGRRIALLVADLERFKTINDTFGRHAGDLLLKEVAKRVKEFAPDPNGVARIGADLFALVLCDVTQEDDVARFIDRGARECFGEPFQIDGTELRVRAKFGIALFPNDGADAESLFRNAEAALKKAKTTGEPYFFYTQGMTERIAEKLTLENRLRLALEKDEFVLHYQPKVELETRRIVGVEALIRWQSPELGLVPPGRFIPLMEETGLILEAGDWAMRRAVLDHRRWLGEGVAAPRVAVNVSAIQLRQRDFVASVRDAIGQGVDPTSLDLEITESMIMEDIEGTIGKLKAVRDLGASIAIDDFGTGYSSLAYLTRLPVQALKIDRSFVSTMLEDRDSMTLMQTIISLAQSLKLKVIAEGVEAEEQAKFLRLLRCSEMQGYLFGRPIPFGEMTALLTARGQG